MVKGCNKTEQNKQKTQASGFPAIAKMHHGGLSLGVFFPLISYFIPCTWIIYGVNRLMKESKICVYVTWISEELSTFNFLKIQIPLAKVS